MDSHIDKSIFDYSSVFKYDSVVSFPKSINRPYKSAFSYRSFNININEDIDEIKENSWSSIFVRKTVIFMLYILIILSFPISMWICIKKVNALERIVLMRLGKLQSVRGPGFTCVLPYVDIWSRIDLRPQTFTISTTQLLTADGAVIEAKSDIQYQVSDVISYVMKLEKQEKTLKDLGLLCLSNIVSEKNEEDLTYNKELICCTLKDELNESALKWGLEVLNIELYSVNVLKAAEPVDTLGTLINVLKATTESSVQHVVPLFSNFSDITSKEKKSDLQLDLSPVEILKRVISVAESKDILQNLTANFQFDIIGNTTKSVYCIFENGHASVFEDCCDLKPDVSVIMTEDNMRDFINSAISPLQAYMDKKVMVTGDWTLLRAFGKMLEK